VWSRQVTNLGTQRVGYVLLIYCSNSNTIRVGSLGEVNLSKGTYAYVGSANMRSPITRVLRHFSKSKKVRWHVDYLTKKCSPFLALICFGVGEDSLYDILTSLKGVETAIPRFGSTDKSFHRTHLFRLSAEGSVILSLVNALIKTCNGVEVVRASDEHCFSQVLQDLP